MHHIVSFASSILDHNPWTLANFVSYAMGSDPMIVHIEFLRNNISDLVNFIKGYEVKAMGEEWFEDLVKNKKNKTSGSMMIAALHSIQKRDDKEIFNKAAKVVADALQKKALS